MREGAPPFAGLELRKMDLDQGVRARLQSEYGIHLYQSCGLSSGMFSLFNVPGMLSLVIVHNVHIRIGCYHSQRRTKRIKYDAVSVSLNLFLSSVEICFKYDHSSILRVPWNKAGHKTIAAVYEVVHDWFTESGGFMCREKCGVTSMHDMDALSRSVLS